MILTGKKVEVLRIKILALESDPELHDGDTFDTSLDPTLYCAEKNAATLSLSHGQINKYIWIFFLNSFRISKKNR